MAENIFWKTLAEKSRFTGVPAIQEIDFLIHEIKPDAGLEAKAKCFRESLNEEVLSQRLNRARILSGLDKEKLDRLSRLANIPAATLLDSGYDLSPEERRDFERAIIGRQSTLTDRADLNSIGMPDELTFRYSLFKHQRSIADRIIELITSADKGCIVHMPTGSGKTRTAMWTICRLITEYQLRCCWITYNRTLISQAIEEFQKAWHAKGDSTCRIGYITGEKESSDLDQINMLFASFGKLSIDSRTEDRRYISMIAENSDVIFIDEAHETQAEGRGIAIRAIRFMNPEIKVIGLTATPGKSPEGFRDEDYDLADHFEQNKVILSIEGYRNPIDYLLDNEYLSRPLYFEIENTWGSDQLAEVLEIVALARKHANKHKKIIVFCSSVETSKRCSALVELLGITSFHIDGETDEVSRARIREAFNAPSSTSSVLFNCNVLATGFDAPLTTLVLICRQVNSIVQLSQMIGRGLRGPRAGGTREVDIGLVLNRRDPDSLSIASMFMNWEHLWSSC
jgi:superfamily II DNA or RNA helicase